ncbi:hypothetical protein B0T18DRAFT_160774 [Schizothecium vesticola]|uniref:Uncharacterized protein n=1 Tax=Schizothecium vesticola TaxID=314040 RepID=A0AA40EWW2_9PEZI|nr:hypothetical protein B0T18DRAFT_160774 [Schizothecium vesticola]
MKQLHGGVNSLTCLWVARGWSLDVAVRTQRTSRPGVGIFFGRVGLHQRPPSLVSLNLFPICPLSPVSLSPTRYRRGTVVLNSSSFDPFLSSSYEMVRTVRSASKETVGLRQDLPRLPNGFPPDHRCLHPNQATQ